ncbi:hypothetical protein MNBD_NITROSPINAE01-723 [hydrothermal vent metagenome]|uniref:FecR protein domain-containing protein n=1 Tax=hydrothermal vent metagenome TaxID=652676 RepID=A0A3B1BGA9_9ZZZZ
MARILKTVSLAFAMFLLLLVPSKSWSDTPIKAHAVYLEGDVKVFSFKNSKMRSVEKNDPFYEGDRIVTGADGVVEIELDTGDLIRVDKGSDMVIKALHRTAQGSSQSVFSLLLGKVKSAVNKLVDDQSKFEYHTKAAVAGVAGTPPFIVAVTGSSTNIDLLGEQGDHGSVYVKGTDPNATRVNLPPGFRTNVAFGRAPTNPFAISNERRQNLNRQIPFKTTPKRKVAKKQPPAQSVQTDKTEPKEQVDEKPVVTDKPKPPILPSVAGPSIEEKIVINALTRKVSKPRQTAPEQSQNVEGVENQTTATQGIIGQTAESTGDVGQPLSSTTIDVLIDLR